MSIKQNHIRWAFDLSTWKPQIKELLIATSCIQCEEKTRLSKFIFRDDFEASLIGRLLMRKFIKTITNLPYNEIYFHRDGRGKPYFMGAAECEETTTTTAIKSKYYLDFNVSHQGTYAVLAGFGMVNESLVELSKAHDTDEENNELSKIGVDIMKIEYSGGKSLNEFFRIMNRNFSEMEWKYINQQNTDIKQTEAFMRHWCLKESYVKNIGVGITIDLQKISFSIKTNQLDGLKCCTDTTLNVDNKLQTNWLFEESLINDNHCVAVAIKNPNKNYKSKPFEIIDFNTLIQDYIPLLEQDLIYCENILKKKYK